MMLTKPARRMLPRVFAGVLVAAVTAYGVAHLGGAVAAPEDDAAADAELAGRIVPGRYVVQLEDGADPALRASLYDAAFSDVAIGPIFDEAFNGFAAHLPPAAVEVLERDPNVVAVEPDRIVAGLDELYPTGIERIGGWAAGDPNAVGPDSDIDIAVIDTGAGPHPDLNVVGGFASYGELRDTIRFYIDCGYTTTWNDAQGHGTFVSGILAARDNDIGVIGMVPGARLWSVRVLGSRGLGCMSDIVAGVEWVTAHADTIEVANMSLGGGNSPALCEAIENSIAAGVTYVVAAGNSSMDVRNVSPANCPGVITVAAFADFDGRPGGLENQTVTFTRCVENRDDSVACFNNFGPPVDILAPGVEIASIWPDGSLFVASGTSASSPYVAGAAARYLIEHPGSPAGDVLAALLAGGECARGEAVGNDGVCDYPWPDDPDTEFEPLLRVQPATASVGPTPTPTLSPTISPTPTTTPTPGPDSDGDGLSDELEAAYGTDPANPDSDGDGCLDGDEVSGDPRRGGLRDPTSPWDFYDISGPGGVPDGTIDLANDVVPVIQRYGLNEGMQGYGTTFDRGPRDGSYAWALAAPDGMIDLANDIVGVFSQYGHRCSH